MIIELTDEEAYLFKMFREYQSDFDTLYRAKVFNIRNGKVILHFNNEELMKIEFDYTPWRKELSTS